jgi:hypothetical protein
MRVESFLHVCAWCRKLGHGNDWIALEDYFDRRFDVKASHGMCPACEKKVLAEFREAAAA